jgi:hypothetical protein
MWKIGVSEPATVDTDSMTIAGRSDGRLRAAHPPFGRPPDRQRTRRPDGSRTDSAPADGLPRTGGAPADGRAARRPRRGVPESPRRGIRRTFPALCVARSRDEIIAVEIIAVDEPGRTATTPAADGAREGLIGTRWHDPNCL